MIGTLSIKGQLQYSIRIEIAMTMRLTKNTLSVQGIYSPRSSYKRIKEQDEKMIADMTLNFDKLTINLLREEFERRENCLTLPQFISITKKHLKFWQVDLPNRQPRLVRYLSHLFNEIDINGNGDMEWEEFTNYIIEKATVLKNLKSKNDEIKHYIRSEHTPKAKADTTIQKIEYLPDTDRLAYYEEGSHQIHFISADNGHPSSKSLTINPKQLVVNISSVKKEKTGKVSIRKKDLVLPTRVRVLDILYLPEKKYRVLLVATSDGYVRGWRCGQNGVTLAVQPDNEEEAFEHHFPAEIYCLAWDHINQVLYCGQKNGAIYMWNLKTDLEKTLTQARTHQGEEGEQRVNLMITTMITMPKLQFMASGRMDGRLLLWDTINSQRKFTYRGHSRGILSLAFNQSMILLFSAGFDHKICIWNPYIETLIHKIEGHLSPILSLRVIEGTHQLISMDSEGIVKVTDTRRFNIISSFSVESDTRTGNNHANTSPTAPSNALSCFITVSKPAKQMLRLVFGGKSVAFYDYDKNYNPTTADEHPVISCGYIKEHLSFYTPAGNKIKVWSALNGDVEKIYMDITSNEITAFDFDFLTKRMVIGDSKGNIALYNTANGAKMKTLTKHAGEVTQLIATQHPDTKVDIFISCALDNEIRISRETPESFEVVRTIYLKREIEVTSIRYCQEHRLLLVASNSGSLAFFDIETGKNVGSYLSDPVQELTSISLASKEMVVCGSANGTVALVGIPPFPYRFQKVLSLRHLDCQKGEGALGVRLTAYNPQTHKLYIVDDKMYLTCYDLYPLMSGIEILDLTKQKIEFERKRLIKDEIGNKQVRLLWQTKAHVETVRVLELFAEEDIVVTAGLDRKVKLWNASTGDFIDSLQQNYNKSPPEPLAYYHTTKRTLYTQDKQHMFEEVALTPPQLDFDPFLIDKLRNGREGYFPTSNRSNQEWSLQVSFEQVAKQERDYFEEVMEMLKEHQDTAPPPPAAQQLQGRKMEVLERKRAVMKEIRGEGDNKDDQSVATQGRKTPNNYFRRSMVKCIQNFVDKNESLELMDTLKKDASKVFGKKKHFDYVPIYKMLGQGDKTAQEIEQHKSHILELARRETENIVNGRSQCQVSLSRQESAAANKLYGMLRTTEGRHNHIPISFTAKGQKGGRLHTASAKQLATSNTKSSFHPGNALPRLQNQ